MTYYISSEGNSTIFDFISEETGRIINKNIKKNFNLSTFVKNDMRNMKGIEHLIIDVQAIKMSGIEELKNTVESFHLLNPNSKVTIVANATEIETDLLFGIKKSFHNYGIITENNTEKQMDQIRDIFMNIKTSIKEDEKEENQDIKKDIEKENINKVPKSPKKTIEKTERITKANPDELFKKASKVSPISKDESISSKVTKMQNQSDIINNDLTTQEQAKKPKKTINLFDYMKAIAPETEAEGKLKTEPQQVSINWNCEDILIGVAGIGRKTGTTTVAFHLAEFLSETGASVAYTEANNNKHLDVIANAYNFSIQEDGGYHNNGITYYSNNTIQVGSNFLIIDIGNVNNENSGMLKNFNKIVVVSTAKPQDVESIEKTLSILNKSNINLILNFVPDDEKESMLSKYNSGNVKVFFSEYAPSLMSRSKENDKNLISIVGEYATNTQDYINVKGWNIQIGEQLKQTLTEDIIDNEMELEA